MQLVTLWHKNQSSFVNISDDEEKPPASKDFIDIYLEKVEGTKDENSSFYGSQGLANLQRSLTDLFGAGSETSTSVLLFAFLYMIKYPDVQVGENRSKHVLKNLKFLNVAIQIEWLLSLLLFMSHISIY